MAHAIPTPAPNANPNFNYASLKPTEPKLLKSFMVSQPYFKLVDDQMKWLFEFIEMEPRVNEADLPTQFPPFPEHLIPYVGRETLYNRLDPSQKRALLGVMLNRLVIIWAEGGAGKTYLFSYFKGLIERRIWIPKEYNQADKDWSIVEDEELKLLEGRDGYSPGKGEGQWVVRKATYICFAPFNTQKDRLAEPDLVGQGFTVAELVKIFLVGDFAGRFCNVEMIVMDEFSLESEWEFCMLLKALRALPKLKRIVLMGDPDQLGPVQNGSPYIDMIKSGLFVSFRLTENHRVEQNARMLTELPKLIAKKDASWIRKIALGNVPANPFRDCIEMAPVIINDEETSDYGSLSSCQFAVFGDRIKANPIDVQVIAHSIKLVLWINRRIMAHLGFIPWEQVKDEKIGHCDYRPLPLFVGQKVILKKKTPVKPNWPLMDRYGHLKPSYALNNNGTFMIRAFTQSLNQHPTESEVPGSNAMSGSQHWDQQSYMWVQKIDDKLKKGKNKNKPKLNAWELEGAEDAWKTWIPIPWKPSLIKAFKPGYAMTIHGFQGNQCTEIILFLESTFDCVILNTGVGRPSNKLVFVSSNNSAPMASKYKTQETSSYTNNRYRSTPIGSDPLAAANAGIEMCCSLLNKIMSKDPPEKLTVMNWWLYNRKSELVFKPSNG
jgi:hypothetical protein